MRAMEEAAARVGKHQNILNLKKGTLVYRHEDEKEEEKDDDGIEENGTK